MKPTTFGAPAPTIPTSPDLRMSSLEIAELMEKQHKHVMRDIKKLIDDGAITEPRFGLSEYKDTSGKSNPMYNLDFQATMVLITGYDAKRRAAVIERWVDLERGAARPSACVQLSLDRRVLRERQAMAREMDLAMRIAKNVGLKGREALRMANEVTRKGLGVGCLDYFEIGLESLPRVDGRQNMIMDDERLSYFLAEHCVFNSSSAVRTDDLYHQFREYCGDVSDIPAKALFYRRLYQLAPELVRTRPRIAGERVNMIRGIGLREGTA